MERTLLLLKPDAIQRGLIGEVIARLERKGLQVVGLKMLVLSRELLNRHYRHLKDEPFFNEIVEFMRTTPVVAVCVQGLDAVQTVRRMTGITKSRDAEPGTIRGDLALSVQCNLVHASDSVESAREEVDRFFDVNSEIFAYGRVLESTVYAAKEQGI